MTERERRILMLVWTRLEFEPGPKPAKLTASRGFTPGERVPCPDCNPEGSGWVADRFNRRRPCVTCGGQPASGRSKARRGRGWVMVDRMDSERASIRTEARDLPTKAAATVGCDACGGTGVAGARLRDLADPSSEYRPACPRCSGSGRRTVARFDLQLERAASGGETRDELLARLRAKGSYAELAAILRRLTAHSVAALDAAANPRAGAPHQLAAQILAYVEERMPPEIRVPVEVRKAWTDLRDRPTKAVGKGAGPDLRARRDKEIRRLDREGKPRQWIAQLYDVSVATVKRIVNGQRGEAA